MLSNVEKVLVFSQLKLFQIERAVCQLAGDICGTFNNPNVKPYRYQRIFKILVTKSC